MTNEHLFFLSRSNFAAIDYSALQPEAAYKVYRFRRAFLKLLDELNEQRKELISKTLSEEELKKASELEEQGQTQSEEYKAIWAKALPLLSELSKQEVSGLPTTYISATDYFSLKQNNSFLTTWVDELLEGVLWKDEEAAE